MSERAGPNIWLILVAAAAVPCAIGALLLALGTSMSASDAADERQRLAETQSTSINTAIKDLEGRISNDVVQSAEKVFGAQIQALENQIKELTSALNISQSRLQEAETALLDSGDRLQTIESSIASVGASVNERLSAIPSTRVSTSFASANADFGVYTASVYQTLAEMGVDWEANKDVTALEVVQRTAPSVAESVSPASEAPSNSEGSIAFAGDVVAGEKSAKKCAACHTFNDGGSNRIGPNLWGIGNAQPAAVSGFSYSSAMKEFDGVWDVENLLGYLENPRKFMPGTKMGFAGLRKEEERNNVVAYLLTLQ